MTARPLAPLPVPVRPRHGETALSYVRRLARANHLRPSFLRSVLCLPGQRTIRADRLAAVSGRSVTALEHTIAGLCQPPKWGPPVILKPPPPAEGPEPAVFDAVRRDAARNASTPVRQLAARHQTLPRMVLQALTPPGSGDGNSQPQPPAPMLVPFHSLIDTWLAEDPGTAAQKIWERLLDEHDADVSYQGVLGYVRRCRARLTGKIRPGSRPHAVFPAPRTMIACQSKRPGQVRGGGPG